MVKITRKAQQRLIETIYRQHCAGMSIDIMRIPRLFAEAHQKIDAGIDYDELGKWMVAFVQGDNA